MKNNLNKIVSKFRKRMEKAKIPFYVIGIMNSSSGKPKIEVVLKRPEKYHSPGIIRKIPTSFDSLKIKVV